MPKTLSRGNLVQNKSKENEIFLAVNELQKVASSVYRAGPFSLTTADAVAHVAWTSEDMPEGSLWSIVAQVQGQGAGVQGYFRREALFFRVAGGVATQTSFSASPVTVRSDVNVSAAIALSGNGVTVTVTDTSARAISWATWIEVRVSI